MKKEEIKLKGFFNGKGVIPFHIDHIFPEDLGGETVINNLVLACRKCNLSKATKIIKPKKIRWHAKE